MEKMHFKVKIKDIRKIMLVIYLSLENILSCLDLQESHGLLPAFPQLIMIHIKII